MHNRQSRIGGMIPLLHLNVHLWQTSRMGAQPGTRPGTGGVTLTEAAAILGISRDALKKRVQRGAIPAYKDETGAWRVVLPAGETDGDMSRDSGEGHVPGQMSPAVPDQLSIVMDQWLRPLVDRIAEQAEEIGGLRADLRGERDQREHAERERNELRARLAAAEDNPPMQSAPVAPGGAQREPEASWRVRLRRWLGGG